MNYIKKDLNIVLHIYEVQRRYMRNILYIITIIRVRVDTSEKGFKHKITASILNSYFFFFIILSA